MGDGQELPEDYPESVWKYTEGGDTYPSEGDIIRVGDELHRVEKTGEDGAPIATQKVADSVDELEHTTSLWLFERLMVGVAAVVGVLAIPVLILFMELLISPWRVPASEELKQAILHNPVRVFADSLSAVLTGGDLFLIPFIIAGCVGIGHVIITIHSGRRERRGGCDE